MIKIKNSSIALLDKEYEEKFLDWKVKQSALVLSTMRFQTETTRLELKSNNLIYERMNPFHSCGKLGQRYMEETFGYITKRSFVPRGRLNSEKDFLDYLDSKEEHPHDDDSNLLDR